MNEYGKVVVTGGAGLIGSHIVDLLVAGRERGEFGEIVVYDCGHFDIYIGQHFERAGVDQISFLDRVL